MSPTVIEILSTVYFENLAEILWTVYFRNLVEICDSYLHIDILSLRLIARGHFECIIILLRQCISRVSRAQADLRQTSLQTHSGQPTVAIITFLGQCDPCFVQIRGVARLFRPFVNFWSLYQTCSKICFRTVLSFRG